MSLQGHVSIQMSSSLMTSESPYSTIWILDVATGRCGKQIGRPTPWDWLLHVTTRRVQTTLNLWAPAPNPTDVPLLYHPTSTYLLSGLYRTYTGFQALAASHYWGDLACHPRPTEGKIFPDHVPWIQEIRWIYSTSRVELRHYGIDSGWSENILILRSIKKNTITLGLPCTRHVGWSSYMQGLVFDNHIGKTRYASLGPLSIRRLWFWRNRGWNWKITQLS